MRYRALLFDFDGVLIESEYVGNRHIADFLTAAGYPTTPEQSVAQFSGHSGAEFRRRLEAWVGGALPRGWDEARRMEDDRVMREGIDEVAGAVAFVRSLDADLPVAVVSSSSTRWLHRHLDHLGLADVFGEHVYSGAEHVARGKPAPDLYRYAADRLGVAIDECVVIEDSEVGVTGAVASGAFVIGLCAGLHCAPGHAERLRALGVWAIAADYDEVAAILART